MQHTDHLSKTEKSIYYVIDTLKCYTEHGFIASLDLRDYSELKIQMRITEVRECLSIVHLEYLNLVEYSLRFNEMWATFPLPFSLRPYSMESIKREFRKSCPISHAKLPDGERKLSVFEKSVLARGGCARDLFGIGSFKDNIQTLFYEQRALFTNVLASLLVCREVITKENETKADKQRCIELLLNQCDDIIADMKSSIKHTQAPVTCEIQKLIDLIGWDEAAQQGFHQFGLDDMTEFALYRNANSQQAKELSIDIAKCYQKSADIRILFKFFDVFRPEPTRKKPSALKVLLAVNWIGGTREFPIQRYYDLLANNYEGSLPKWHTVSVRKNDFTNLSEQQEQFNRELSAFIAEKKGLKSGMKAI